MGNATAFGWWVKPSKGTATLFITSTTTTTNTIMYGTSPIQRVWKTNPQPINKIPSYDLPLGLCTDTLHSAVLPVLAETVASISVYWVFTYVNIRMSEYSLETHHWSFVQRSFDASLWVTEKAAVQLSFCHCAFSLYLDDDSYSSYCLRLLAAMPLLAGEQ